MILFLKRTDGLFPQLVTPRLSPGALLKWGLLLFRLFCVPPGQPQGPLNLMECRTLVIYILSGPQSSARYLFQGSSDVQSPLPRQWLFTGDSAPSLKGCLEMVGTVSTHHKHPGHCWPWRGVAAREIGRGVLQCRVHAWHLPRGVSTESTVPGSRL